MKKALKTIAVALIATGGIAVTAHANERTPSKLMNKMIASGMLKVTKTFKGPNDMLGYAVSVNNKPEIIYATRDGKYLFLGDVLDASGHDLTDIYARKYLKLTGSSSQGSAVEQASHTAWIQDGHKGKLIYAFTDPNCIFCHELWLETRELVSAGKMQIRWIPVGVIKRSSLAKAEAILGSADPLKALAQDERGFNVSTEEGAIRPASDPAADIKAQVASNERTMESLGFGGTPAIVFKADGKSQKLNQLPPLNTLVAIVASPD